MEQYFHDQFIKASLSAGNLGLHYKDDKDDKDDKFICILKHIYVKYNVHMSNLQTTMNTKKKNKIK